MQLKCDRPDDKVTLSGQGSNQERISAILGKLIAQLAVRMLHVYRPEDA
jgi:hypothetical protein